MSFFGSLVKKTIALNQTLSPEPSSPVGQQRNQLIKLLKKAKTTAFGKYYGFEEMINSADPVGAFRAEVPIFDYQLMHQQWWHKQQKHPDITWPGKPGFFALSSGTTGKSSKRIPVTEDFLQSVRDVGTMLMQDIPNFDFPEELFESEILMLSSSANLNKHDEGHLEGEISGINVSNFPGWYDLFYRPGKEIASINTWDERVERIAKEAPDWNIGAIAGIPSWVLLMLKEIIVHHKLSTIHDIWPNLSVYASGGVAFETYRKDFDTICKKPLTIIDTYLASEGFFSCTTRPGTMAMKLALSHGYFYEFVPFDERGIDNSGELLEHPVSLTIDEVETKQDYVLVVSSCAGAWRYVIGDTIKFTQLDPPEILITGRTKFFLNVVGSQLSEEKMDKAILEVSKAIQLPINEYAVAAIRNDNDEYIHQWVVVSNESMDEMKFAELLDETLRKSNKNYQVARNKALKGVEVKAITKDQYYAYLEKGKKKGGQTKTPKVMKEEGMNEFLAYVST